MNKDSRLIVIIGPYTHQDPVLNTRRAVLYGEKLVAEGHLVLIPHLTMLWHMISPHDYQYWLNMSCDMIRATMPDEAHRLTGESHGAEVEEKLCHEIGVPVITVNWWPK